MSRKISVKTKQQRSITSFFGANALTSSPVKRKAPAEEEEINSCSNALAENKNEKEPLQSAKKAKLSPPKPKKKITKSSLSKSEEDLEPIDVEDEAGKDVEMEESEESEADEQPTKEALSLEKQKVTGRKRLRQRVTKEESDSEDELSFISNSTNTVKQYPKSNAIHEEVQVIDIDDTQENEDGDKTKVTVKKVVKNNNKQNNEATPVKKVEMQTVASTTIKEDGQETQVATKKETLISTGASSSDKKDTKITTADSFFTQRPAKSPSKTLKTEATIITSTIEDTENANVITDATENNSETISYSALANLFSQIEGSSSRLVIQDLLTNFFRDVIRRAPNDLLACIYLCVCTDLAPPFENLKIGIGDAILIKAIGEATGTNMKFIKEMYQKEGDLGKVAQNARSKQHTLSFASMKSAETSKPSGLSVQDVYNQFVKIAKMTGNNSQAQKCSIIKNLLVKCEKDKKAQSKSEQAAEGAKYIIRGLQGKLRIGLAEKSILIGLTYSFMTLKDHKDKDKQQQALAYVKKAFSECPSYNALVAAFQGVQEEAKATKPLLRVDDFAKVAQRCVLMPGTPVSPMLARPTKAYAMVFDRFEGMPFTCEYKYDGERAQIHLLPNGEIAIFSRNFENSTERFPDVKLLIAKAAKKELVKSCILDAEVVAVDRATNKRLPFQILSTRSRKNVKVEDIKVPVCIYAFDLLFVNGKSMLTKPLAKRRAKLRKLFTVDEGNFEFATSIDIEAVTNVKDDPDAMEVAVDRVRNFLDQAVKENCEGLMVKTLEKEATYEPANRSHKWLKLKKDYLDGIGDSTDLVPIGAFYGRGKRTGFYGAYLLACYDPETEMFQAITKLGTGLSEELFKQFYDQLREKVVDKVPSEYAIGEGTKPDVWFEPSCVWEILGADLSISPKYTAAMGLVAREKGISLRFPRFIRVREDKHPHDATTSAQIADLYQAQGLTTVSTGVEEDDDDMLI